MKPNKNFELGVDDVELIEACLHKEVNRLSHQRLMHIESTIVPEDQLETVNEIDNKIKQIHNLLGRLHNKKIWYRPKQYVGG
jgi:hypothetical protein